MLHTLIIEDEPLARIRLRSLIENGPQNLAVIAEADRGHRAITLINQYQPDLIFLDLHLPDMSGFAVLHHLQHTPLIIFTTAYSEYAVEAFEKLPVDYLVKPIRQERFNQAVSTAQLRQGQAKAFDFYQIQQALTNAYPKPKLSTLPLSLGDRIILMEIKEIAYFQAEDKYTCVYDLQGKRYLLKKSLNQLLEELPAQFIRIHRSSIVNQAHIHQIMQTHISAENQHKIC